MRVRRILVVLIVAALAGCGIKHSYAPTRYYGIEPPVPRAAAPKPAEATLAVRPLAAGSRHRERILYREGPTVVGYHENDRWVEAPAEMLSRALEGALKDAKVARVVADDRTLRRADFVLEGRLLRFDEVHRQPRWIAECELELLLKQADGERVLLTIRLAASQPARENTTSAFAEAMNAAVGEVMAKATEEVAKALAGQSGKPAAEQK